jgi:hypothetical protein
MKTKQNGVPVGAGGGWISDDPQTPPLVIEHSPTPIDSSNGADEPADFRHHRGAGFAVVSESLQIA